MDSVPTHEHVISLYLMQFFCVLQLISQFSPWRSCNTFLRFTYMYLIFVGPITNRILKKYIKNFWGGVHQHAVDFCILFLFIATFLSPTSFNICSLLFYFSCGYSLIRIMTTVFPLHFCSMSTLPQLSQISTTMLNRRGDSTLVLFLNFEGNVSQLLSLNMIFALGFW